MEVSVTHEVKPCCFFSCRLDSKWDDLSMSQSRENRVTPKMSASRNKDTVLLMPRDAFWILEGRMYRVSVSH